MSSPDPAMVGRNRCEKLYNGATEGVHFLCNQLVALYLRISLLLSAVAMYVRDSWETLFHYAYPATQSFCNHLGSFKGAVALFFRNAAVPFLRDPNVLYWYRIICSGSASSLFAASLVDFYQGDAIKLLFTFVVRKDHEKSEEFPYFKVWAVELVVMFCVMSQIWILVCQFAEYTARDRNGNFRTWYGGYSINLLRMVCLGNSVAISVLSNSIFKKESDLKFLYKLYYSALFLNLAKGSFDDWFFMDMIFGSIVCILGNRAVNLAFPSVCGKKKPGIAFDAWSTFGMSYVLGSRFLVYFTAELLHDISKWKVEEDNALRLPDLRKMN